MSDVLLDTADRVAVLTLDRAPVNALSSAFYSEISTALERVARDDSVHVLVLRSASRKAFCAGADITELAGLTGPAAEEADVRRQELARRVFGQLLGLPQPSIAVVDGPAIGAGAVIASCCDMRMGSPRAGFVLPEVNVGRCGGGRHLMRHLPQGVVRRMYFTATPLISEEALRYGFLDSVYDDSEALADAALERARGIAAKSPVALRLGKAALNESEPLPVQEGYAVEQRYTLRLARTDDAREALAARREKRAPAFTGQ
ncbi:enoyl-CoA hydratase-related protein [Streptomyces sp. NPDC056653]|uniref:enoyl-CoA hydratase-related protein n=1 Tax=Streptomyces sp. NPDC056653 TaxID=3345894 RepID=UPI00367A914E